MKILWVEDEHRKLSGLFRPLQRDGAEIVAVECARAGVEAFKNCGPFDLCVVDLIMPHDVEQERIIAKGTETDFDDFEGLYVVREIRAMDAKVPIVVLTVVYDDQVRSLIRAMNAEVIQKGAVLPGELCAKLKSILGTQRPMS